MMFLSDNKFNLQYCLIVFAAYCQLLYTWTHCRQREFKEVAQIFYINSPFNLSLYGFFNYLYSIYIKYRILSSWLCTQWLKSDINYYPRRRLAKLQQWQGCLKKSLHFTLLCQLSHSIKLLIKFLKCKLGSILRLKQKDRTQIVVLISSCQAYQLHWWIILQYVQYYIAPSWVGILFKP